MAIVVYVDDSGSKEYSSSGIYTEGLTQHFVFGAVIMSAETAQNFETTLAHLKFRYFGTSDVEIKSTWLRNPVHRQERYIQKFSITDTQLVEFVESMYSTFDSVDAEIVGVIIDKKAMQKRYTKPHNTSAMAYEILAQRLAKLDVADESVQVIMDKMSGATPAGNQYMANLKDHHKRLIKSGASFYTKISFRKLKHSIDFRDSKSSHLIQFADLIAYNIFRQFRDYGSTWLYSDVPLKMYQWFERISHKVRRSERDVVQGYGIILFPDSEKRQWRYFVDN